MMSDDTLEQMIAKAIFAAGVGKEYMRDFADRAEWIDRAARDIAEQVREDHAQ